MSHEEKKKVGRPRQYTPEEYKERRKEQQRVYQKEYYLNEKNKERHKNYMKEYMKSHPEYWDQANEKRRIKKLKLKKLQAV